MDRTYYYKTERRLPLTHYDEPPLNTYDFDSIRGFNEVDKFLKNASSNNVGFFGGNPSVMSMSTSSYLDRPPVVRTGHTNSVVGGGTASFPKSEYSRQPLISSVPYSSYPSNSISISSEANKEESKNSRVGASPPSQSILYADEEERTRDSKYSSTPQVSQQPLPVSRDYKTTRALPQAEITENHTDRPSITYHQPHPFSREEKRRKSSAFKSLRSFLRKHLRFSSQAAAAAAANHNYSDSMINKKASTASLYGGSRPPRPPLSSSTHNINGVGSARLRTDSGIPLTRAQSFSSSKARNQRESAGRDNYPDTITQNPAETYQKSSFSPTKQQQQTPSYSATRETARKDPLDNSSHPVLPRIPSRSASAVPPPINRESKRKFIHVNTPCLMGILNHGNTCYMNAILQCLACIDRFAVYFVCQHFDTFSSTTSTENSLSPKSITSALAITLQSMWFNANSDSPCLKLLRLIASSNPHFQISCQQDAQESLIWLLDRIHEEIKDDHLARLSNASIKFHKSEEELASDALRRVSGSNRSAIMDLFRAQFRSSMECSACGFFNLTFDPYMTVSLSVPQPKSSRACSVTFVPFFNGRQLVRYKIGLGNSLSSSTVCILHMKEKIMESLGGSADNAIACQFSSNGQCHFLANDLQLGGEKTEKLEEFTLVEVPRLSQEQEFQDLVVAIITHVVGFVPNGGRRGQPYTVVLSRQWSYERISKYIIEKGTPFMFSKAYFPLHSDFRVLIQHSSEGVIYLDPGVTMPLFNEHVNRTVNNRHSGVLKMIVEWNSTAGYEFLRQEPEPVINDFSFFKENNGSENGGSSTGVTLLNLLQDYIKTEVVADWKCPKCFKSSSGKKELKFHSMPPVLVFHLKRFELLNDGATKKVESKVQIPLEALDMSPYICNPDSRHNTLLRSGTANQQQMESSLKWRKGANEPSKQEYPLYDLVGVVHHFGERTNSGHYTATTRNPVDNRWRTFDDMKVTYTNPSDIRSSGQAYLLFYERRSDASKLTGSASWFPYSVPDSIISLYTREEENNLNKSASHPPPDYPTDSNGNDESVTVSGGSTFYTGTLRGQKQQVVGARTNPHPSTSMSAEQLQSPARSKSFQTLQPSARVSYKNRIGSNDVLSSRGGETPPNYPPPSYRRF